MSDAITVSGLDARCVVRVMSASGDVVGSGVLLGPDLIGTCAHVVAQAVGADYGGSAPSEQFVVEFPLAGAADQIREVPRRAATVLRWEPIAEDGTGDIALCRLNEPAPAGVRMPPLRRVDELWDLSFRVFGFPDGSMDGVWSTGRFRSVQGTGWCQLQGNIGEQRIEEGYSGAPVWDDSSGAVVGLAVAADRDEATTTAYLLPIEQLLGLDPDLLPCPYRGLEAFGEEHSAFFFGREDTSARIRAAAASHPVVMVVGPSGSGKSSVVRAGVLPGLRERGAAIVDVRAVPEMSPARLLAAGLLESLSPTGTVDNEQIGTLAAKLSAGDTRWAESLSASPANGECVVFVDQYEELVATDPYAARELLELLTAISTAANQVDVQGWEEAATPRNPEHSSLWAHTILTSRRASLDEVLLEPQLAARIDAATVTVPPMTRDQLRQVITGPAERAPGLGFEAGLVELILDDTATEPGNLPLLESLLTQLWNLRSGGWLTLAAYHQAGGVAGAVSKHAEDAIAGLTPDELDLAKTLLTRLTQTTPDGGHTRQRRRRDELPLAPGTFVDRLVEARVLVAGRHVDGHDTLELAHQALIDHWPRLRRWLTDDTTFLIWRDQAEQQHDRWVQSSHDNGSLLRGTALAAAESFSHRPHDIGPSVQDFIRRSRERELRETRRLRAVAATLAVLLVAALTLSVTTITSRQRIARQLATATADITARIATANHLKDPVVATQLAMGAWKTDPTSISAQAALGDAYTTMRTFAGSVTFPKSIAGVKSSENGDTWLVTQNSGIAVLTGLVSGHRSIWNIPNYDLSKVSRIGLSPDGAKLYELTTDGSLGLWDITKRSDFQVVYSPSEAPNGGVPLDNTSSFGISPDEGRIALLYTTKAGTQVTILGSNYSVENSFHMDEPQNIGVNFGANPDELLVRTSPFPQSSDGIISREVVRIHDGKVLRQYPPGVAVDPQSGATLTCGKTGDPLNNAYYSTDRAGITRELPNVPTAFGTCTAGYDVGRSLTYNSNRYVVTRCDACNATTNVNSEFEIESATDTATGEVMQYVIPRPPPDHQRTTAFGIDSGEDVLAVVPRAAGLRPELAVIVRSNSLILISGKPVGHDRPIPHNMTLLVPPYVEKDERTVEYIGKEGVATVDAITGSELGWLPFAAPFALTQDTLATQNFDNIIGFDDALARVSQRATYLEVDLYDPHTLAPLSHIMTTASVPPDGRPRGPGIEVVGDRVTLLVDNTISFWNAQNGQQVSPPMSVKDDTGAVVCTKPQETPDIAHRPGHSDQVAVVGLDGNVEIWDTQRRVKTATIAAEICPLGLSGHMQFDPTGHWLDTTSVFSGRFQIWDADTGAPTLSQDVRASGESVYPRNADGQSITVDPEESKSVLHFRDPSTGLVLHSMLMAPFAWTSFTSENNRISMRFSPYSLTEPARDLPIEMPTTSEGWFEELCKVSDRGFTAEEAKLLPEGADTSPPCTRH